MRMWILLVGLLGMTAQADILWMKNGDRLTGHVQSMEEEQVRIALPYGEPLTVRRDAIKRWRLDKPGKHGHASATQRTESRLLASQSAQTTEPHWFWAGDGDLSVSLKRNAKQTDNIDLSGQVELADLDWRYTLEGKYIYDTVDGTTKSHKYQFKPMVDYFLNQQWFWRSSINYQYDMLSINYLSIDYGTGPGYRFWNDKRRRLELISQGGISRAYWRDGVNELTLLFGSHNVSYPFASLGWDYRQPLWSDSTEIFSDGTYIKYLNQPSPYVTLNQSIQTKLGLRYYLNDYINLSWRTELDWDDTWLQFGNLKVTSPSSKEWRHLLSLGASF